ncbi:hypothetical protein PR202_gb20076 [Eleusine coracana subsp. coracana]|uniref:Proteasome subunit alpha type n=1 Tax=Eleusine coracana subsp. coracana TaxID=191504 RepID=A0AAV5F9R5_ELECO|nr:hypothetical protein PR202_gb20076 [Eleusine coracana subsp. coracana]
MGDSQYSFSLTTFSPSGKLVQIEHALTAVGSGQTSLGIKAANGVVIATEKKLPSILVDETSVRVTSLIPLLSSFGHIASLILLPEALKNDQCEFIGSKDSGIDSKYWSCLQESIPVTQFVRETAAVMQEFTQSGGVRPFGVSLLIAGYDDNGPQLYQVLQELYIMIVDPSGSYFSWKASAMGKMCPMQRHSLRREDMELDDAIHTAILTLKEGYFALLPSVVAILFVNIIANRVLDFRYEGQISSSNIEIGIIRSDHEFKVLSPAEIKDFLEEVE